MDEKKQLEPYVKKTCKKIIKKLRFKNWFKNLNGPKNMEGSMAGIEIV